MSNEKLIGVDKICKHYRLESTLFTKMHEFGFIEIHTVESSEYIHIDQLDLVEKVIRMRKELRLNMEGIDTALHLLEKIEALQKELHDVKNRLRLFDDEI